MSQWLVQPAARWREGVEVNVLLRSAKSRDRRHALEKS